MSALNCVLDEARVVIAVDSLGLDLRAIGQTTHSEKMVVLPNAGCVVACTGRMLFLTAFTCEVLVACLSDFDAIEAALQPLLASTMKVLPLVTAVSVPHGHVVGRSDVDVFRMGIAGWSRRRGRMAVLMIIRASGASPEISELPVPGIWFSHWDDEQLGEPCEDGTLEAMQALVRIQATDLRRRTGDDIVGGNLVVAELTRHDVNVRRVDGGADALGRGGQEVAGMHA